MFNEIAPKFEGADGLVAANTVFFASANATLIAVLDRLFHNTHSDKTIIDMNLDYIDDKKRTERMDEVLKDINMEFRAGYISKNEMPDRADCGIYWVDSITQHFTTFL